MLYEVITRIIMLERTTQIDSQAAAELHESLRRLQDEIYRLKGELEFYQGVMSSTSSDAGLNIQGMQVDELPGEGNYHFRLILTHVTKRDRVIEGKVDISFEGVKNGKIVITSYSIHYTKLYDCIPWIFRPASELVEDMTP